MKTCMTQNSERNGIKQFKTRRGTGLIKKTETREIQSCKMQKFKQAPQSQTSATEYEIWKKESQALMT